MFLCPSKLQPEKAVREREFSGADFQARSACSPKILDANPDKG
jgi:hypothetical protein